MRRIYLLFALFVAAVILLVTTTVRNSMIKRDINFICSVFKEKSVMATDISTESGDQSLGEIDLKIRKNLIMKAVKKIWLNSMAAPPGSGYFDFKNSSEQLLKESWDCKAMEAYFSQQPTF